MAVEDWTPFHPSPCRRLTKPLSHQAIAARPLESFRRAEHSQACIQRRADQDRLGMQACSVATIPEDRSTNAGEFSAFVLPHCLGLAPRRPCGLPPRVSIGVKCWRATLWEESLDRRGTRGTSRHPPHLRQAGTNGRVCASFPRLRLAHTLDSRCVLVRVPIHYSLRMQREGTRGTQPYRTARGAPRA